MQPQERKEFKKKELYIKQLKETKFKQKMDEFNQNENFQKNGTYNVKRRDYNQTQHLLHKNEKNREQHVLFESEIITKEEYL